MDILQQIAENMRKGNSAKISLLIKKALEKHTSPQDIIDKGLIVGMNEISYLFKRNEIYIYCQ